MRRRGGTASTSIRLDKAAACWLQRAGVSAPPRAARRRRRGLRRGWCAPARSPLPHARRRTAARRRSARPPARCRTAAPRPRPAGCSRSPPACRPAPAGVRWRGRTRPRPACRRRRRAAKVRRSGSWRPVRRRARVSSVEYGSRGSGPMAAHSTRRQLHGAREDRDAVHAWAAGTTPCALTSPREGLSPMLFSPAGTRPEPAVSVPSEVHLARGDSEGRTRAGATAHVGRIGTRWAWRRRASACRSGRRRTGRGWSCRPPGAARAQALHHAGVFGGHVPKGRACGRGRQAGHVDVVLDGEAQPGQGAGAAFNRGLQRRQGCGSRVIQAAAAVPSSSGRGSGRLGDACTINKHPVLYTRWRRRAICPAPMAWSAWGRMTAPLPQGHRRCVALRATSCPRLERGL